MVTHFRTFETADSRLRDATDSDRAAARKSGGRNWLSLITLLLVIVLAGVGFLSLQLVQGQIEAVVRDRQKEESQLSQVMAQEAGLLSQITSLHSQLATLQGQMDTKESKFERALKQHTSQHEQRLDSMKSELEGTIQAIQRQLGKTRGDVLIADAEYLMAVGNERLHLAGDVKTALAALEAADQRLRESGDPAVFEIRQALAQEITALKAVAPPDIVGTSSRILALEAKVEAIPVFLPHVGKAPAQAEKTQETSEAWFDSALTDLKGLVVVRRTDKPVEAILVPEEVLVIRQTLRGKLEMARFAMIERNAALYKANLQAAKDWLNEYFDTDAPQTQEARNELQALEKVALQAQIPDVSQSLRMLRKFALLRVETDEGAPRKDEGAKP